MGGVERSLFDPVVPDARMNALFRQVREGRAFTAARRLMDEVFAGFRDIDGSFVREFQTGGFSPRVFELALFAYLTEQEYDLDRSGTSPDFIIRGETPVAIEATTSNPQQGVDPDGEVSQDSALLLAPDDVPAEEREFVFQAGKVLRRKLLKRDAAGRAYWEQPHVAGMPFVIALEAFHSQSALYYAVGTLAEYLYGRRDVPSFDANGRLHLSAEQIGEHRRGSKSIPSGLFALPEAAQLAAVLFTNSSTVSKFNRIGTERGYGPADLAMIRVGTVADPDPDATEPRLFGYVVGPGSDRPETFGEGLHVLHNPWAATPLPTGALRGVTEHELMEDGRVLTTWSTVDPFASQTQTYQGKDAEAYARRQLARFLGLIDDAKT